MGSYYLFHGGAEDDCPYTSCSNADFGERYTPGFVVAKDECPTEDCPNRPAPPGYDFATAGSCDLTECRTGKLGTFYTQGCTVGNCTNGNARSDPTRITHDSYSESCYESVVGLSMAGWIIKYLTHSKI